MNGRKEEQVKRVSIEVHYTVHIAEKDLPKLLEHAEQMGYTYGDPGKKETVRRLLIEDGYGVLETVLHEPLVPRDDHPVKPS